KDIPLLLGKLGSVSQKPLPAPIELTEETRPAVSPEPHLFICRKRIGPEWDTMELIVGIPTFRYGDSPRLAPLASKAPPTHVEIKGNSRITWPRDPDLEAARIRHLHRDELAALSNLAPPKYLDATTRDAVVLLDPLPTP